MYVFLICANKSHPSQNIHEPSYHNIIWFEFAVIIKLWCISISKRFVVTFYMTSESNDFECGVATGYASLVLLKPKSMTWAFLVEF